MSRFLFRTSVLAWSGPIDLVQRAKSELAAAGERAWKATLAMGKMASGVAMIGVGASLDATVVGIPLGAALVANGVSNITGGAGDWANTTFGTNYNLNLVELVASDASIAATGQDLGKPIALVVDVVLSGGAALAPRLPVVIAPSTVSTAVGYGARSEAAVGSRVPLANDVAQTWDSYTKVNQ